MREESIIHDFRYKDRKRYYRLKDPRGTRALLECSEDALPHIALLIGEQGKRYRGAQEHRLKMRRMYEMCAFYEEMGIEVDGLCIARASNRFGKQPVQDKRRHPDSIFNDDGTPKKFQDILKQIDPSTSIFLTRRAIRKLSDSYSMKGRYEMFRAIGLLIKGRIVYEVYSFQSAGERWTGATERQLVMATTMHVEQNLPAFAEARKRLIQSKAIIYLPTVKEVGDMVPDYSTRPQECEQSEQAQKRRTKAKEEINSSEPVEAIDPLLVYNIAYVIPLSENAKDITEMLLIDGWRHKLESVIPVAERAENGELEFGWNDKEHTVPIYNLLCCSIGFMRQIIPRIRSSAGKSCVVIHDWQKGIVEELYGNKAIPVEVDEDTFKNLLQAVKICK